LVCGSCHDCADGRIASPKQSMSGAPFRLKTSSKPGNRQTEGIVSKFGNGYLASPVSGTID